VLKRDPVVSIVLAMVASLLLVFGFNKVREAPTPEMLAAARMKGQAAHEFALQTTDGKMIHLSDLRGRAVVLNFWSTTCEPCKVEMPWLIELQKQYGPQGLQILGMAYDPSDVKDIAMFAKDMNIDYPILVGAESERNTVANNYGGVAFLPETFFIGRDGKVSEKTIGLKSKDEIEESIRKALAQDAQSPNKMVDGPGSAVRRLSGASAAALKPSSE
jgi:peroxiredoxin